MAIITSNRVLVSGSLCAFFKALKALISFLASLIRTFFSFADKLFNSATAAFTLAGCQVPDKEATPMPEKPYELQHDTKKFAIYFENHRSKLSAEEQARLEQAQTR